MPRYQQRVSEMRIYTVRYVVEADNEEEAKGNIALGKTIEEHEEARVGVINREPRGELEQLDGSPERPVIVCLCGSTRFAETFREANLRETLAGKIVLSIGCDFKSDAGLKLAPEDKKRLDQLHLHKIDLADEVLFLNVGGYMGESTRRELEYAKATRKKIRFLEEAHE